MFRFTILLVPALVFLAACTTEDAIQCINALDCEENQNCIDGMCVDKESDTGNTGNTGNTGDSGNTGNTGDDGNTGNTGDDGNTGNTGDDGNTGNTGDDGNTGNTGDDGNTGNTGDDGNTGNTGDDGNTGNTGDDGNTGNTGDDGNTGNTGDDGNTGNTGFDPCDPNPCLGVPLSDETCIPDGEEYSCGCTSGYSWDQTECVDIDECAESSLNNCSEFADCTNIDGSHTCECRENYSGDGIECTADTRVENCTGLPDNGLWNSVSQITQTWNGSGWLPSATGVYNIESSTTECRFLCNTNYSYNEISENCLADTRLESCAELPDNASWNSVSQITQIWDGTDWVPSVTGTHNTTPSITECQFVCNVNYTWNGSVCVADTRTFNCAEKPEPGTVWNTISSYSQTWDGSNWIPADNATHYNETPDTQSCRFKCYSMYSWVEEECVSDGYCGDSVVHNDRSLHSGNSVVHLPLDEGEGAVATDISGHNNNGTILGNPAWVNGRFGKALSFDGVDDTINWWYSNGRPENNFTMMAWVKTSTAITIHPESNAGTNGTTGQRYVFYPDHGGEGCPWAGAGLSVGTNGIIVAEHCGAYAPPIAVYSGAIGSGWNHIAVTYTNKQPRIYLNGTLVRTGLTSTQHAVRVPISSGNGWDSFAGTVDDIRIFDRSLSNSEIRGFVTGPVIALSMDESTGDIAFDSSGNGNNGTIYGGSRVAGSFGSAVQFDSVSDYITLPASNSIVSDENGITVSLWVKADPVQASQPRITSLFRGVGLTGFNIGIIDGEWASYSGTDLGGTWLKSGISIDSDWHHIVATNDGTTHRIYVDGIERDFREQSFSVGATAAVVGRVNTNADLSFKGIVDEVRIYNRPISASEVLSENLEFCDGTSGVMACSSVNPFFNSGDVTCNDDCGFDFSGCGFCGDGIVSGPEQCDGAAGLMSCNAYDSFFHGGTLSCNSTCDYDFSNCQYCGDGIVNGPEQCDDNTGGCTSSCELKTCQYRVVVESVEENPSSIYTDVYNDTTGDHLVNGSFWASWDGHSRTYYFTVIHSHTIRIEFSGWRWDYTHETRNHNSSLINSGGYWGPASNHTFTANCI